MNLHLTVLCAAVIGCSYGVPSSAEMIHQMARKGDVEKVLAEIEKGVPVDTPSTSYTTVRGISALTVAAQFGHKDVVQALLERGADPNFRRPAAFIQGDDDTLGAPLHAAAGRGHVDVVRILIEAGADPLLEDPDVGTPLHLARRRDHEDVAKILVENGAVEIVEAPSVKHMIASADVENGRVLSNTCGFCHSREAGSEQITMGPSLWEILGRPIGKLDGFDYSGVMASRGGVWDYDSLNSLLASPTSYMPGTKMEIAGFSKPEARADLIAYLRTLSDDPMPMP